jgi:hypothetical protein
MIRGAIATISALSHGKQGLDHHRSRLVVNAPRSARHPFEMFDNVGDVGPRTIDAGLGEVAVEQLSRRSDKRVTGKVVRTTRKQCNGAPPRAGRQSSVQGEVARVHLGDANLAAAWSYSLKRHIVPVAANAV